MFNKILAVVLSTSFLLTAIPGQKTYNQQPQSRPVQTEDVIPAQDTVLYTQLESDIAKSISLLESLLDAQYEDAHNGLLEAVEEKGWNEELSLQAFYDKGNPYGEVNYEELLAALCIAIGDSVKYNIVDIKFLRAEYIEAYAMVPVSEVLEDGTIEAAYGETVFYVASVEDILMDVGIAFEDVKEEYESRLEKIQNAGLTEEQLEESIFIQTMKEISLDEAQKEILSNIKDSTTENRAALIDTAISLIGQVPYQWGGKAGKPGYDKTWWTYQNGVQKGLDCSGFVQWCFMTCGYNEDIYGALISTTSILENCEYISQSELQPGDLGLLNFGESINHVGIYLGNGYFIHCNSADGTVSIGKPVFHIYMRVPQIDTALLNDMSYLKVADNIIPATEEEIYLIAQLVWHEARGEGVNGWIAVTEVIINRVRSERFPDNIHDVIYQNGQFAQNEEIADMEPSEAEIEVVKMVVEGKASVLNNEDVVFFRNPGSLDNNDDWGKYPFCQRINRHAFYKIV